MLGDILDGQEKSQFILITDTVHCCGRLLLLNTCLKCLQRDYPLILVCLERPSTFFTNWLPSNLQSRLTCIDGFKSSSKEDLNHKIFNAVSHSAQPCVITFDSLSPLLLKQDTPSLCRFLQKLKSNVAICQIIALLHHDVHDESVYGLLKHQAASVLELKPSTKEDYICHIRHCRPTGKVLKSIESVYLDDSLCIQKIQPVNLKSPTESVRNKEAQADPTSQLTFNLSLTDSEKEARSQIILPYMKERFTNEQAPPQTGGKIHYEPDDADDLDEEDPDDDLNI